MYKILSIEETGCPFVKVDRKKFRIKHKEVNILIVYILTILLINKLKAFIH